MAQTPDQVYLQVKVDPETTAVTFKTALPCSVHHTHIPATHVNEIHHIWPLGYGGPNVKENKAVVCATGHNSIHELMNKLLKWIEDHPPAIGQIQGQFPAELFDGYALGERRLARLGVDRIQRQAL